MRRSNSIMVGFALLFAVIFGSSEVAFGQYLPGSYGYYMNWGAYPAMNATAMSRTVYSQKAASERQSLAQVQRQHAAQNKFLLSQSRSRQAYSAQNTRAASEAWIRSNQPRRSTVYVEPSPAAARSPSVVLPIPDLKAQQSDKPSEKLDEPSGSGINWPSLLRKSTCRTPRVSIETIMAKAEPNGLGLTKSDYRAVVMAVNRMKGLLEGMAENLNAAEYIALVNYLDRLTDEAKAAVKK